MAMRFCVVQFAANTVNVTLPYDCVGTVVSLISWVTYITLSTMVSLLFMSLLFRCVSDQSDRHTHTFNCILLCGFITNCKSHTHAECGGYYLI